jgi:hypothetical protein
MHGTGVDRLLRPARPLPPHEDTVIEMMLRQATSARTVTSSHEQTRELLRRGNRYGNLGGNRCSALSSAWHTSDRINGIPGRSRDAPLSSKSPNHRG